MKFQVPAPVEINEKPYSLLDMARFVTTQDARYNRTADAARSGVRVVTELERAGSGGKADLADEDLRLFATVLERPTCGWGRMPVEVPAGPADPRTGKPPMMTRNAAPATAKVLPLIDAVAAAAAQLPPPAEGQKQPRS